MTQPPILPYKTPNPYPPHKPKNFLRDIARGSGLGILVLFLISGTTETLLRDLRNYYINDPISRNTMLGLALAVFFILVMIAVAMAVRFARRERRYGRESGAFLAPFFIVLALGFLAFTMCSGALS